MERPKLTVIISVYNERETVLTVLRQVKSLPVSKQILVVDHASTDGTRDLLKGIDDPGVQVILLSKPLGKGVSVKLGFALAKGEWVIIQDADLEYDPNDILKLLSFAETKGVPVVFGSRLLGDNPRGQWSFHAGRVILNFLFRLLFRARTTDVATCYKLLRTDVAKKLRLRGRGFELDFELAAVLRRLGYTIWEVPIHYWPRSVAEGKKLRPLDGLKALRAMVQVRLLPHWLLVRDIRKTRSDPSGKDSNGSTSKADAEPYDLSGLVR